MDKQTTELFKKQFETVISEYNTTMRSQMELVETPKGDDVDIVQEEIERELKLKLNQRNSKYIVKVKDSLQKVYDGSFGECEDCGEHISIKRLLARPTACLCINCKEVQERQENQIFHRIHDTTTNVIDMNAPDTYAEATDGDKKINAAVLKFEENKKSSGALFS